MMWYYLVLTVLAVWRLTHLLNKEDGPFDIIFLMRQKAGAGFLGNLLDCFYCLSMWVSLPFAIWLAATWKESLLAWLAISGAACLLEQATANNSYKKEQNYYRED